jgi:signal transduction histidine kinase
MFTSKTLEESSIGRAVITYWRRFVELVTGLRNKYWGDLFFRSEFNVILLQFVFAAILLFLVGFSFNYLYRDVSDILIRGITESIRNGSQISGTDILTAIHGVKTEKFYGFLILTAVITLCFSYIIAKITLTPVRDALQSQKRFVSDIAHELRTPLSVIKTSSEVALMDDNIRPDIKKTLENIVGELDRTSEIINNLLSFSSLVRPERVNFGHVDLGPIIDSSINKLQDLAENKHLDISVRKIAPHNVWGNATALEQVVVNLLKNAINYTPSGGYVSLKIEPDYRGSVILTVQDSGIGISRHDLLHIFEPFYRAERSRNRQSGSSSSGLGLTIVSELIKLHSGKIVIQSFPNRGTTATVMLPQSIGKAEVNDKSANLNEVSIDFLTKRRKSDR